MILTVKSIISHDYYEVIKWLSPIIIVLFFYGLKTVINIWCYLRKIRALRRIPAIIKKHIKKHGYTHPQILADYIYEKYGKIAYMDISCTEQHKYKLKSIEFERGFDFEDHDYVHYIALMYSLYVIEEYRTALRKYLTKFEMFKESDIPNLLPAFRDFLVNEYGQKNYDLEEIIVHKVLDPLVEQNILRVTRGNDGDNIYEPAVLKASNVTYKGTAIID